MIRNASSQCYPCQATTGVNRWACSWIGIEAKFSRLWTLCVDDGSEDDTVDILDSIPGSFNTLRLKKNAGVSHARNCGIRITDSEWIAFLDSDDVWHPQKLEKQIDATSNVPNIFSISLMKYGFAMESGSILNSVTKNAKDGSFSPV